MLAAACSVTGTGTVIQTADPETVETEVAGVFAQAGDGYQSTDEDDSSAFGFRLDPSLESSLAAVQVGIELDEPSAQTDNAVAVAPDDEIDTGDAAAGGATDGGEGDAEVPDSEWVPADDAAAQEAAAPPTTAHSGPLDDLPPGPGAGPVWVATAKPSTGYVQLYDAPNGTPISATYHYLDGSTLDYQVWNPTFFGGVLSLLVVGGDPEVDDYVEVQLPVRPTGTTAWLEADLFEFFLNDHYVEIDVGTNTVRAWHGTELILESSAVTGRPDRPTPLLRTYIDEKLPGPNSAYGPWMLTLAAFSESLNTFGGGLPKLAAHGTNQPELMGQYASSGCIRLPNAVISELAELVPVGTRVDIIRS